MVGPDLLPYAAGIALVGMIAGFAVASVARAAKIRRQVEPLRAEVDRLKSELAVATSREEAAEPRAAEKRWTATEIAAIVGAFGTLIATVAATYNSHQGRTLKEYQEKLATVEAKVKELESASSGLADQTRAVFGSPVATWLKLETTFLPALKPKRPETFQIADRDVTGPCDDPRMRLTYNGYAPAIVHCTGRASIALAQPTRILLVPDTKR